MKTPDGDKSYVLSFVEEVVVDMPSADRIILKMPVTQWKYAFEGITPGLARAIDLLSSTGALEDELAGVVMETDGASVLARLYYYLLLFAERQILRYGVCCEGRRIATLVPASAGFGFTPAAVAPQSKVVLSRFAYLRRERDDMVLQSPLAQGKIVLHGWEGAAIATELARALTVGSLCERLPGITRFGVALFVEMLVGAGFACALKPGEAQPAESEALAQWEFHDLLFHAASRRGRHLNPTGGTYRFNNKIDPPPAVKQSMAEETIDLYRPDIGALELADFPFTLVLEERRSIREYAESPITDRQLGEFLYRSARVKELRRMEIQELSRRPYPGAGAIYELELYVTAGSCVSIPPGLHHYCPKAHRLEKICGPTEAVDRLLKDAARAGGLAGMPQVLITIAARFQRLSWKYESLAYSLLLKDVGVLYQTLYLVATAMDLAPCALGAGNSDLFSRAAGLDYYAETSVGEFLVGSKRT